MFDRVEKVFSSSSKRNTVGRRLCREGLRLLELVDRLVLVMVPTFLNFGDKTFNSKPSPLVWTAISRDLCVCFLLLVVLGATSANLFLNDFPDGSVIRSSDSESLKLLLLLVLLRPFTSLVTIFKSPKEGDDDFERIEVVSEFVVTVVAVEVCLFVLVLILLLIRLLLLLLLLLTLLFSV